MLRYRLGQMFEEEQAMLAVRRTVLVCMATAFLTVVSLRQSDAALTYYYDPDTGTVAFDTANTRSGGLYHYYFYLNPYASDIRFRVENLVRISNTTLFTALEDNISDASLTEPVTGYYSIGAVLPAGLSEDTWLNLFDERGRRGGYRTADQGSGFYGYNAVIGGGEEPPAEFVYGLLDREFDNRFDLIDPDSLTWAEQATLVYHAANGRVDLVTDGDRGGYTSAFLLQSVGRFIPENYHVPLEVPLSEARDSVIGLFADLIEPGKYNLGKILEKGMTPGEFQAVFTQADFYGRAGFGSINFDLATQGRPFEIQYIAVPEPASASVGYLLAVGGAVAIGVGRRRQSTEARQSWCWRMIGAVKLLRCTFEWRQFAWPSVTTSAEYACSADSSPVCQ